MIELSILKNIKETLYLILPRMSRIIWPNQTIPEPLWVGKSSEQSHQMSLNRGEGNLKWQGRFKIH
jgi:hypothetical protein